MRIAPISRVETPQLVVHACCCVPSAPRNWMSLALREVLAEEVARAGLQRLAVLHHRLDAVRATAPGKRSPAVFSPLMTGIAIQFSAKSA